MATLTPTLTLTSSDTSSDALSLTVTDSLTVTVPSVDVQRKSIGTSSNVEIFASDAAATYVYFKNTDSSNVIVLREGTGNQNIIDLAAGEFCFFPLKGNVGIDAIAVGSACVLEYGFWTKG